MTTATETYTEQQIEQAKMRAFLYVNVYNLTGEQIDGLTWDDVDLERGWLSTGKSGRPLHPFVVQALRGWRESLGDQRLVLPFAC